MRNSITAMRAAARPADRVTLAELDAHASRTLVEADDALATSAQQLGLAVARFGEHAAAPFSAALNAAQAELAAAFALRMQLDEAPAKSHRARRSRLTEILARCDEASRLLDARADSFDQLRSLPTRVSELLPVVGNQLAQLDARIARSERLLGQLETKYTPGAIASVASSPVHARARLEFAAASLADATQELGLGQRATAAVFMQAAESAADQAESLLDAILHQEAGLTQASSALPTALRELDADTAEAAKLPSGDQDDRAAGLARAREAAAGVRGQQAASEPFDVLAALRELVAADFALNAALEVARDGQLQRDRATAVLDQVMLVARGSVVAADDFISMRRGAVGAAARTCLAEAHRHFHDAFESGPGDPQGAVTRAQRADALASQARSLAADDVAGFSHGRQDSLVRVGGLGLGSGMSASFGGLATRFRHHAVLAGSGGRTLAPASQAGGRYPRFGQALR